ncbi:hypothetical protein EHO60_13225 [Leptospira fletcheri]|uniref:C1q domain-containing protein n=1 Tax=Leptospira fletcheri TaxID=2484981 RepID=A0A4R9GBD7_9LEPT|nr:hypothetical protein [Leptospira fletcheri]TGK08983.1 hypothetical protein EHO60_13225 [Leptospira fletcheri]
MIVLPHIHRHIVLVALGLFLLVHLTECTNVTKSIGITAEAHSAKQQAETAQLLALLDGSRASFASVGARVIQSNTVAMPNGYSYSTFNSVEFDTGNFYSSSAQDRLTIPSAGTYFILGQLNFDPNATGERKANIMINGGARASTLVAAAPSSNTGVSASCYLKLAAGDILQLQAYQSSGGALNITAGTDFGQALNVYKVSN